jgi:protein-disulfide isomerase
VRVVWRHLSFIGADTQLAAEASECAAEQGRFWPYHDRLLEAQPERRNGGFAKERLKLYGAELRLEAAAFDACVDSGRYADRVKAETEMGRRKGVSKTPTLFVNGLKLEGVPEPEALDALISSALRTGRLPRSGA